MILTFANMWECRANPRRDSSSKQSRDKHRASEMDLIMNFRI